MERERAWLLYSLCYIAHFNSAIELYKARFACYNIVQLNVTFTVLLTGMQSKFKVDLQESRVCVYLNISITCRMHYHFSFVWLQIHQVVIHTPHCLLPSQ